MHIKMLSTRLGSPDGIASRVYVRGTSYGVPDSLAEAFLREGWAEKSFREKKNLKAAPENK